MLIPNKCNIVQKPWGTEKILINTPMYCGKILTIMGGEQLSWQFHKLKDETIYVLSGELYLYIGHSADIQEAEVIKLMDGQSYRIQPGVFHRMTVNINTNVFEISTHHEDLDTYRVLDDYNRDIIDSSKLYKL